MPLADAGIGLREVAKFWDQKDFSLELPTFNGRTLAGNCTLCFLKPATQVASLIAQRPERAEFWIRMESLGLSSKPTGAQFRSDRPSYAAMLQTAGQQVDFIGHEEEGIPCYCGD